ncbi:hypothetical protein [Romboutsia ilealis]|uniref:hypothetical protein n=1 Tax=Romboutsia ilealis TaxID=1115758 RepID=UPI0024950E9B|nr:hypothetical protein [Romboutsia ilealis]
MFNIMAKLQKLGVKIIYNSIEEVALLEDKVILSMPVMLSYEDVNNFNNEGNYMTIPTQMAFNDKGTFGEEYFLGNVNEENDPIFEDEDSALETILEKLELI